MTIMKAIILKEAGGTEQLQLTDLPVPTIKDDEVLIQVKAISINPVDVKTRLGKALYEKLKEQEPVIIGWDIAGIITQAGANVTQFNTGDEVFGMVNFPGHGKAYAEYVAAPASHLALKPKNISFEEAAATTLAPLTAWQVMSHEAKVSSGQKVLIHAASGGVGHYAVQLAKYLGAYVVGTSSAANKDFVLELGADEHIDYKSQKFEEEVSEVDFVLNPITGNNIMRSLDVIKPGGTLISIVGGITDEVTEKAKSKDINAFSYLVKSDGDDMKLLAELLEKRVVKAHVYKTYSLENIGEAHQQVESGHTVGKVVVTI